MNRYIYMYDVDYKTVLLEFYLLSNNYIDNLYPMILRDTYFILISVTTLYVLYISLKI